MLSMEARRNPVNQAAVAFYLLAALITAAVLLRSAGTVSRDAHVNLWHLVDAGVLLLIGVLVQRRSLVALVIGTALFVLICIAGLVSWLHAGPPAGGLVVFFAVRGTLLFIMVRGIVALARKR